MTVTVWIVVNRETGEVNASARSLSPARIGALRVQGCEVFFANVGLPEWFGHKANVQQVKDVSVLQRAYEQRDEWKRRAEAAEVELKMRAQGFGDPEMVRKFNGSLP